jgi:fructoselysine-6-P-deglycase FrlB-like protein
MTPDPGRPARPAVALPAAARRRLRRLRPDGPDEMGRELAQGPDAVAATLARLDRERQGVEAASATATRIVVVGTGASLAMARAAAPTLRIAELQRARDPWGVPVAVRPVVVRESTEAVFGGVDGDRFRPADLVIAISQSGESPETVAAARRAAAAGAVTVALTAHESSPLAGLATRTILVPIDEERGAATKSELATLAALLALGGALPTDEPAVDALRDWLSDIVDGWPDLEPEIAALAVAGRTWITGLGPTAGLAYAGCLLWHEKVHREVAGTSVSEFRHGPVEACGPTDAVLVVAPARRSPDLDAYLGLVDRELRELRASLVRLDVAELCERLPSGLPCETAGLLGALLQMQQLARGTAHAAGTYVDGFHVLRRVVRAAPPRFD